MSFKPVDTYPRQQHFDLFSSYAMPMYSLTFEMEVTGIKTYADRKGFSFYLNLCYIFTRAMSRVEAFRYRVREGRIVLYDHLEVAATLPAPDGLFSFAYLGYDPDPEVFNRKAARLAEMARKQVMLPEPGESNQVLCTALPGIRFTGLTHARTGDPTDARPRLAFGKTFRQDQGLMVPVGLEVNHIFIDGSHLSRLVERVEEEIAEAARIAD
jgi:chloramphenicol O-acetyltransferase type A